LRSYGRRPLHGHSPELTRHPAFNAVNTVLSNIKTAIVATFRSDARKHAPRRLAEFAYRFNLNPAVGGVAS